MDTKLRKCRTYLNSAWLLVTTCKCISTYWNKNIEIPLLYQLITVFPLQCLPAALPLPYAMSKMGVEWKVGKWKRHWMYIPPRSRLDWFGKSHFSGIFSVFGRSLPINFEKARCSHVVWRGHRISLSEIVCKCISSLLYKFLCFIVLLSAHKYKG